MSQPPSHRGFSTVPLLIFLFSRVAPLCHVSSSPLSLSLSLSDLNLKPYRSFTLFIFSTWLLSTHKPEISSQLSRSAESESLALSELENEEKKSIFYQKVIVSTNDKILQILNSNHGYKTLSK